METVDPAVLLRVPAELVVVPVLLYPQVGRHHLLPEVLKSSSVSSRRLGLKSFSPHLSAGRVSV